MSWKDYWRPAGGWPLYAVVLAFSVIMGAGVTAWAVQLSQPPLPPKVIIAPTPGAHTSYVTVRPVHRAASRAPPPPSPVYTGQASIPGAPYSPPPSPTPDYTPVITNDATPTPAPTPTEAPTSAPADTGSPSPGVTDQPPSPSQSAPGGFGF